MNDTDVIIACRMLEDEVGLAMENTGCTLPVVWLERGLHEFPDRLRDEILSTVHRHAGADTILLAYALCGNAMLDVGSETSRLVTPRFHDCIHMSLTLATESAVVPDTHTFYFTRGWLEGKESMDSGYQRTCKRHGEEKALRLYRRMLSGYTTFALLDTGAYPLDDAGQKVKVMADRYDMDYSVCAGTVRVLEKLFRGEWDEEFCIAEPGCCFQQEQFL